MNTVTPRQAGVRRALDRFRVSRARRFAEVAAFVAIWVALGYVLRLDSEAYLLLGVPLTLAFQLVVRRRPLRELWVREGERFRLDRRGWILAAVLMASPLYFGIQAVVADQTPVLMGWWVAAAAGAVPAAYALRSSSLRAVLRSAALATAIGAGALTVGLGGLHVYTGEPLEPVGALLTLVKFLAVYFPLTFVLEEVTFRGALDAHVHQEGDSRGWWSAVYVSALWGLWHLPIAHGLPLPLQALELVAWHCLVGVPLSMSWRRSGNLAGPGLSHAAIDAVRNALMPGL